MIPINPEAIGDPNTTPVVYVGERDSRDDEINDVWRRLTASEFQLEGCIRDLAAARAEVEQLRQRLHLAEGRIDGDAWDRLTEERDAERAKVAAVRALAADWGRKCLDPADAFALSRNEVLAALGGTAVDVERERTQPVVDAAKAWRSARYTSGAGVAAVALAAAVDTYESQEGTDGN